MPAAVKNRSLTVDGYRQYHTKTPNAPNNQAPAAKKGLMIVCPDRSHANADNAGRRVGAFADDWGKVIDINGRCCRD